METMMTEAATTNEGADASEQVEGAATEVEQSAEQQPEVTEAKAEETKTEEPQVPESYEFKEVEGCQIDESVTGAFAEVAKELGMTQENAQKVLDKMAPAISAQQTARIEAAHQQWRESSIGDKEFGGEKLQENLVVAKKAMDTFGTPELKALLDESGLGNHPEVIRVFYRAGKAISEDGFVGKGNASKGSLSAQSIYSNTQMNP